LLIQAFFLVLIFVVAVVPRLLTAWKIDMTWDEATYTFCGVIALSNILHRRFSSKEWELEFHPPLGMLFIGAAYGIYIFFKSLIGKKGINETTFSSQGLQSFKGRRALLVIRMPSIIMGALIAIFVFLISLRISNDYMVASTAALLTGLAPNFIAWTSLAMLESTLTLFYTAEIWMTILATSSHYAIFFSAAGVLFGLMVGTKISGVTATPVFIIWFLIDAFHYGVTDIYYVFLWAVSAVLVYVLVNPVLWNNPIGIFLRNLKAQRALFTRTKKERATFHIETLFATTPLPIVIGALFGLISLFWFPNQLSIFACLTAVIPLIIMSSPGLPKYGVNISIFVLPSLTILTAIGIRSVALALSIPTYILDTIVILSVGYSLAKTFPYCIGYQNFFTSAIAKTNNYLGQWGEGISKAISYVEENARAGSTVWAYAPKSTSLYHSTRANMRNTFGDEPLFTARQKAGFNVEVDSSVYDLRKGDIRFYYPYYYDLGLHEIEQRLNENHVEFIVLYRAALSEIWKSSSSKGNNLFCEFLSEKCRPAYVVSLKGTEVCWIFKVTDEFLSNMKYLDEGMA
jgi:hypothetical protein